MSHDRLPTRHYDDNDSSKLTALPPLPVLPSYTPTYNSQQQNMDYSYQSSSSNNEKTPQTSTTTTQIADDEEEAARTTRSARSSIDKGNDSAQYDPTLDTELPGKSLCWALRLLFYGLAFFCAVMAFAFAASTFRRYWNNKDARNNGIQAWKSEKGGPLDLLPIYIGLGATLYSTVLLLVNFFVAALRPSKNPTYYGRRFVKSEYYELITVFIMTAASIFSFVYSLLRKPYSLWSASCTKPENAAQLFPKINYAQQCNDLNNVPYLLLAVAVFGVAILILFLIQAVIKRKDYNKVDDNGKESKWVQCIECFSFCFICCAICDL